MSTPPVAAPVAAGFSAPRLLRLMRVELAERWRTCAAFLLVVAVVQALLVAVVVASQGYPMLRTEAQGGWYFVGLLASGYVFAHVWLAPWQRTDATLLTLMRPAAVSEKWALIALMLLVLYPLAYTAVFGLVYGGAGALAYHLSTQAMLQAQALGEPNPFTGKAPITRADYALFLPFMPARADASDWTLRIQAAWALVYSGLMGYAAMTLLAWSRAAGMKALGMGIALLLLTGMLMPLGEMASGLSVLASWLDTARNPYAGSLPLQLLSGLFWLGVPALLWLASYTALRERNLA